MQRTAASGMLFAFDKLQFLVPELRVLGLNVNASGVEPDPTRCEELINWPDPRTTKEVQPAGLHRDVQLARAQHAAVNDGGAARATRVVQAQVRLDGQAARRGHHDQGKALGTDWILTAPFDPCKETIIQTDSSAHAMGWVLLQYDDNIKARRVVSMGSRAWPDAARRMPAHELESAALMFKIKRRSSELMQTPIRLETDSEASAQMLSTSTTIVSQLPAKYQRWRAFLSNFESVKVSYVGYKGVAMADQLSRQAKWYRASSSLLLHVAVVAMGYTAQDVQDIAAGLLGDLPQALMVVPLAADTDGLARAATQLSKLLAAQAACPEALEMRKKAQGRPTELKPGDKATVMTASST